MNRVSSAERGVAGAANMLRVARAAVGTISLRNLIVVLREHHLLYPAALFVFLRIWHSFWAALAALTIPPLSSAKSQYYGMMPLNGSLDRILWAPWQRWDTIWYTKIAEQGYSRVDLSTAFFPLYPLLIRISAPLFGNNGVAAGVVIASVAALVSFILLYRLACEQFGEAAAERTVLYLAVFPTAFFLFAAYTESLFLALALGSFIRAKAGRWGWAGILGGLAGLTRPQGMLLLLPLGIEFLLQSRRGKVSLPRIANLFTVFLGGILFWCYLAVKFQNPAAGLEVQSLLRQPALPWESLGAAFSRLLSGSTDLQTVLGIPDLAFTLLFLGLTFRSFFKLSPTYFAYMAIIIAPPLFSDTVYNPVSPVGSMSRYVLAAFPAFMLAGQMAVPSRWLRRVVAFSLLLQTLWHILFAAWIFVG
jgi:hypothetical protein